MNEGDATSSRRIFIKIMMQEMTEGMGLKALAERVKDPEVKRGCEGMFPMDVPKNTRIRINYLMSIGLDVFTEQTMERSLKATTKNGTALSSRDNTRACLRC
jgi:pre-mRNA-splicing factor CWC22